MSQINIDTIADRTGSISTPAEDVIRGSARAFVNFNGTGTVAIRASYNVDSITDNGVGDYSVNFTNAMPDADYSLIGTSSNIGTGVANIGVGIVQSGYLTSSARVTTRTFDSVATLADREINNIVIFR